MATSFQATAKSTQTKKMVIIVDIITDFTKTETKVFLLPDKRSDFVSLVKVFDSKNSIDPPTLTKKKFKEEFIDYTLSPDHSFADRATAGKLNSRYNSLFRVSLKTELESQLKGLQQLQQSLETQMTQTVEDYKKAKAQLTPSPKDASTKKGLESVEIPAERPSSSTSKPKVKFPGGLTEEEIKKYNTLPKSLQAKLGGFVGDKLLEARPFWRQYAGEVVMNNENNAWVVLGRDFGRPGIDGSTGAGAVWICAGLSPHDTDMEHKDSVRGPTAGTVKQKRSNLVSDAAYLYLSQKCDVDTLLPGLAGGTYKKHAGPRLGESVAVVKADDVVLVSRKSGIRLITGTDKKSSSGGKVNAKYGIDLIAGNNDSDLQPMVKGDNLITYLTYLSDTLSDLGGVVYKVITDAVEWKASVMTHRHYDPVAIGLGGLGGVPFGVFEGKSLPSQECIESGVKSVLTHLMDQMNEINRSLKGINNDLNGLQKIGSYSIRSSKNRAN